MKALVVLLALAGTAHAYPVFVATDEPEPDRNPAPATKLGFRLGFGRVPLADDVLGWSSLGIGVEHRVFGELRMLAEYEYLWLGIVPDDPEAASGPTSIGHRTSLGFRYAALAKNVHVIKFYMDVEAGAGLAIYDVPGETLSPHGFVGTRLGWQIHDRDPGSSRTWETELHIRALVVEHGIGLGGGLGFYWGD